jgi:hypothetical protein
LLGYRAQSYTTTGRRLSSTVFMRTPRVSHDWLRDRPHRTAASHPPLHLSTSEGGQQQYEGLLWPPLTNCRIPGRKPSLVVLPAPGQREVAWAAAITGRRLQGIHQIKDVVSRIQHHCRVKMVVVQLDGLVPYLHGS